MKKQKPQIVLNRTAATTQDFQRFTFNVSTRGKLVRNDTMEGRDFIVVPMVMLKEGVWNGSQGPLFYPAEELAKFPEAWNHKPVVVYHPQQNGKGVTASDPVMLTAHKIGVIMNTVWDAQKKELKAEAWLEKARIEKVDNRISEAIENETTLELSTGLFTENEMVDGEFDGKKYIAITRNLRADHLAVLPDQQGAFSIEAGGGFIRNQAEKNPILSKDEIERIAARAINEVATNALSHENIRDQLRRELMARFAPGEDAIVWVEAVFDGFVIFEDGGKLLRIGYTINGNDVELAEGQPEEVIRVTEFRTLTGEFVGNLADHVNQNKEYEMDKEKIVNDLIKNKEWSEEDREFLMSLNEERLKKIIPKEEKAKPPEPTANKDKEGGKAKPVANADPEKDEAAAVKNEPPKPQTVEEYIANAPEQVREVLNESLTQHGAAKEHLIKVITANESNIFSEEELRAKKLSELKGLAALAAHNAEKSGNERPSNIYLGQGEPARAVTNIEPLTTPTMNFEKKDK